MSGQARRARELVVNASLVGSTAVAHLVEDPFLFALQTARRLPRVRALSRLVGGPGAGPVRHAVAAWLADRPAEAREHLDRATPRTRAVRRVSDELAVQLGVEPGAHAAPRTVARSAWTHGHLTAAVEVLGGDDALGRRYADALAQLQGRTPAQKRGRTGGHGPVRPAGLSALHVLVNSLPHTQSGYAARSHAVLRAQAAAGIRVVAATRLGYPVTVGAVAARHRDVVDGVTYHRLLPGRLPRTESGRLQRQVEMVEALVREHRPAVLHTTTHHPNAWVTRAVAARTGLPWVYEVRGLLEDSWVARRTAAGQDDAADSEYYRLSRERETEAALSADHVVTLSETLAADLVGRGVPTDRITVVPNGVDEALLTAERVEPADAREHLGLPRDGFWVGTVSSLVDYEGLETLLQAVAALRRRDVDVRVCLAGDGVSRPSLVGLAHSLELGEHAVFPGRVDRHRARDWHKALDVFAVPRHDVRVCRMVTPLKPVEAMALERPVVVSDLPALRELVTAPGTGLPVPAGDVAGWAAALQRLMLSDDDRLRFAAAGRSFASGRTWASAGQTYRVLYEDLGVRV
ncbi:glycosyltransferase family 4 protein [Cellulomonas bogoriensis]|uniref:Glycosyl transferase n=1 Tax=Cellulomonas bogoriensis 69B4 = DSM 16987 TaxID=1386082 RepID=A0A0A0C3A1_9CELL|nr:glycosyltransferase family 4 protein [Cellulomonas bogoriensis]KGM13824.1 glycosyl transferase [Cellulomonas bogoriensis 69B4 = DSM 16987]